MSTEACADAANPFCHKGLVINPGSTDYLSTGGNLILMRCLAAKGSLPQLLYVYTYMHMYLYVCINQYIYIYAC